MGNHHSASHAALKPRKNVHWKSAGRPAVPGKPDVIPILTDDEPNAVTLRWAPSTHDGGAPLLGYQVECNRLGGADWVRTAPPLVVRPELVLTGLEPPHRYQFRVAALNAVGRSEYSELSDVLTVSFERALNEPPIFLQHLNDVTILENEKTEFRVTFSGIPTPTIAWFKDDYEIFSSRRTAITTDETSSVLVFHQTLASDEGEVKCTATNRAGHAVSRARLSLEAAPKLRYPRQYEDGLLYEINETVFLKTTIVGKPTPTVEWRHDGQPIVTDERVEISNTPKFSVLKIHSARRSDRGEYQVNAKNNIGEDTAAFLVTITAPPDPPQRVSVTRQVDKSVTLTWEPPEDDGGCRIGNYIIEYYRGGWNVWLKATTSRKTTVTLFDLIEGSEYRFRIKAESPYGMSSPSVESAPVKIPGRAVDMEFLAVESKIISQVLTKEDGDGGRVSPAPRRKRQGSTPASPSPAQRARSASPAPPALTIPSAKDQSGSNEFMLVLYPDTKANEKTEKRKSFQLELEDALSPPPLSLSAPELSARCVLPFRALRNAVSSTELLHEAAMARFYKAVAMEQAQNAHNTDIPHTDIHEHKAEQKLPEIVIKQDSTENSGLSKQSSVDEPTDNKWQQMSFDEDYTASTVSTDDDYSDDGSINDDVDRDAYLNEENTYNPRDKMARPSPLKETIEEEEEESEREVLKPLPLPDPNFVPKPILKRRETDTIDLKPIVDVIKQDEKTVAQEKIKLNEKPKKEEKMTIFQKITKMPVQKSFPFPKLLNKAKEPEKTQDQLSNNNSQKPTKKVEKVQDKISEEGRTVIDYYGNIVKEYGSHKKPATPLYLNTDELKSVAEKQQTKELENDNKKLTKPKRLAVKKPTENNIVPARPRTPNKHTPNAKAVKAKTATGNDKIKSKSNNAKLTPQSSTEKLKTDKNIKLPQNQSQEQNKKYTKQVVLRKAERATIIIPIDYQQLEKQAKVTVRSAIDYTVDMCLLLLAFWVYFFKDERLAIPFLVLIIYRQVQETLLARFPTWVQRYTPNWLKKKAS
ncbi:unnamed protein product [Diatraea saccharalis]|uniref:Titin n=1 Tax=Diatraea saccharalis TaxID=40085 RepID=A0A9N9QP70_9NEOP|nr:unnamed protein product [Diatraea saccharalis]